MAKGGGKSSASSGTRKKHARKAAGPAQELLDFKEKRPKEKGKGKSKEPRKKVYIPPSKPAPVIPDPLESTGLARTLPADLYITLKGFGKKDTVTKSKALEKFQSDWVNRCLLEGTESALIPTLVGMLPVWVSAQIIDARGRI